MTKRSIQKRQEAFFPSPLQHHLLKAALSEFEEAKTHWGLLKQALQLESIQYAMVGGTLLAQLYDKLDEPSSKVLPMVYKNLKQLDDPLLQSIKSFYRYTWARNYCLYNHLRELSLLLPSDSKKVVLKGMAMAFYYMEDPATRVMGDMDVLMDEKALKPLLKTLESRYSLHYSYKLGKFFNELHAATFRVDRNMDIDLHWQLFPEHTKHSWNPFETPDCLLLMNPDLGLWVLNPTYTVFHVIVHGVKTIETIRWILDCAMIQREHTVDWMQALDLAQQLGYVERFRIAFRILQNYGVIIPAGALEKIDAMPVNKNEFHYLVALNKNAQIPHTQFRLLKKFAIHLNIFYWRNKTYKRSFLKALVVFPIYFFDRFRRAVLKK